VLSTGNQNTLGLYRFDAATHQVESQRVVNVKDFDFEGSLRKDPVAKRILGVDFLADAPGTVWTDPAMKAVQARIDAWLPSTVNQISCSNCLDAPYLLVRASSDREPGAVLVFDRKQDKLIAIGSTREAIKAKQMGERSFAHFKARDGLDIPVYVTRPAGAKGPTPAVVYVHGGTWARGTDWLWSPIPQSGALSVGI